MSYNTMGVNNKESEVEWEPLLTAMGRTRCLDRTGGLAISPISIKPIISKSGPKSIQINITYNLNTVNSICA